MADLIEPVKLTDWKNEPTLLNLKHDLVSAQNLQQNQVSKINRWNDLLKSNPTTAKLKGRSNVQSKLIRKQAEWRYPSLSEPFLSSEKLFKVSPVTFEDMEAAKQNELVLNHQFRTKLNRVKFIDDLVRSVCDDGTAIVRTGWNRVTTMVEEEANEYTYYELTTEEEITALQEAVQFKTRDPRTYEEQVPLEIQAAVDYFLETDMPVGASISGTVMALTEKVLVNQPTCEVLDPRNVYIDPTCGGDFDKAMFAIIARETSKADLLKENKKYVNLDTIDWSAVASLPDENFYTGTPVESNFADKPRKKVVLYEYWGYYDIDDSGSLTAIHACWLGNQIIYLAESPFSDKKIPLTLVNYLPVKRELYGEPDAEILKDNQAIQGAISRGIIDLLGRSANSQRGIAKGMLDYINQRRYENGQDYEFNPQSHPNNGIVEHKYPELPQSALTVLAMQGQEAEALTGVKSFSSGISGATYGDVAVGVRGALDASAKREMAILRRLAKGIIDIGTKIISMNGDFLSDKEVVRITNSEFVTIKREDLVGQFDLSVDISTAEVDNNKVQDLAFLLQTIGNNMDSGITLMILAEIAELKRMPALADKIKNFKPEPDPVTEKMKQLELAKLELELSELESEIALNNAKARQASSKADITDLDYVEQETGTKHARDLDKHSAQARANQDLEITKSLIKERKPDSKAPNIDAAIGYNAMSQRDLI